MPSGRFYLSIGNRYIGIRKYATLHNGCQEAAEISEEFVSAGFATHGPAANALCDATASQIQSELSIFLERIKSELDLQAVAIYLSGHGYEADGDLKFVGNDGADAISLCHLLQELAPLPGIKVVFADMCRQNPTEEEDAGFEEAVDRIHAAPETDALLLVAATSSGAEAHASKIGEVGPLVRSLREMLRAGPDEEPVAHFLDRVAADVAKSTDNRQIPKIYGAYPMSTEYVMAPFRETKVRQRMKNAEKLLTRDPNELDHILTYYGSYSQQCGRMLVLRDRRIIAADLGIVNDNRFLSNNDFQIMTQPHAQDFYGEVVRDQQGGGSVGWGARLARIPFTGPLGSVLLSFENAVLSVVPISANGYLISLTDKFDYLNSRGAMMRLDADLEGATYERFDKGQIIEFRDLRLSRNDAARNLYLDRLAVVNPNLLSDLFSRADYSNNISDTGVGHYVLLKGNTIHAADRALAAGAAADAKGKNLTQDFKFIVGDTLREACASVGKAKAAFLQNRRDTEVTGPLRAAVINCDSGIVAIHPFKGPQNDDYFLLSLSPWRPKQPETGFNFVRARATVGRLLQSAYSMGVA